MKCLWSPRSSMLLAVPLCASLAGSAAGQVPPPPADVSPAEACEQLCDKLYEDSGENRALCLEGCEEAARCTAKCSARFAPGENRERCNYRCARGRRSSRTSGGAGPR